MGNILKHMLHGVAESELEDQLEIEEEQGLDTTLTTEKLYRLSNDTMDDESEDFRKLYLLAEPLFIVLTLIGLITVTFMSRRRNLCPNCLGGYFALAVPVNFFELKKRRKPFLAAFALVTMSLVDGVIGGTLFVPKEVKVPVYLKVVLKLGVASAIGCNFYPLFAFIYMASLPSCIIGLIYHILHMSIAILAEIPQPGLSTKALIKELLLRGIVFSIAGTYIFYWYIKQIFRLCSGRNKYVDNDPKKSEIKYVKSLFIRQESDVTKVMTLTETKTNKCTEWFQKKIYRKVAGFRYSLTILASCLIGFLVITHISIVTFYEFIKDIVDVLYLLDYIKSWKTKMMGNFVAMIVQRFSSTSTSQSAAEGSKEISYYDFIYSQSLVIVGGAIIGGAAAYILSLVNLCHLLSSHRDNVLNLSKAKNNQNILPITKDVSNTSLVKSAIQYGGYQVAYLVAGFTIQLFVLNVVFILLGEIIVLPIQFAFWSTVVKLCEFIGPIIIALILIQLTQYLMIRFLFLVDHGQTLALDNRRGFFIMSYFVFFYNIFTGLFSCIKRILMGSIMGILFVPRLDKSIFPRMFEKRDSGFKAYSSLLHLEALQSNPIVITFVHLLTNWHHPPITNSHNHELEALLSTKVARKKQVARTRWFVTYTLVRNPSLIKCRGTNNALSVLAVLNQPVKNERETNV